MFDIKFYKDTYPIKEKITKGNIFDWVDTDTWSLKDGS